MHTDVYFCDGMRYIGCLLRKCYCNEAEVNQLSCAISNRPLVAFSNVPTSKMAVTKVHNSEVGGAPDFYHELLFVSGYGQYGKNCCISVEEFEIFA